jgi:hypothetical protein
MCRNALLALATAAAVLLLAACGSQGSDENREPDRTFTITKLDERNPSAVRAWSVDDCAHIPASELLGEGRALRPASIARARSRKFPRIARKAAYEGCLDGLRSRRASW